MKKKDAYNENEFVHDMLDYLIAKQEVDQIRLMKMIKLEKRNQKAIEEIEKLRKRCYFADSDFQKIINILKGGK